MSTGQRSMQSWSCELRKTLLIMHSRGRLLASSICNGNACLLISFRFIPFVMIESSKLLRGQDINIIKDGVRW